MKKFALTVSAIALIGASPAMASDAKPVMTLESLMQTTEVISTQSESRGTVIVQMVVVMFVILAIGSVTSSSPAVLTAPPFG